MSVYVFALVAYTLLLSLLFIFILIYGFQIGPEC